MALQIGPKAGTKRPCGEVFLDRSLGLGDYTFVVATDPALVRFGACLQLAGAGQW